MPKRLKVLQRLNTPKTRKTMPHAIKRVEEVLTAEMIIAARAQTAIKTEAVRSIVFFVVSMVFPP